MKKLLFTAIYFLCFQSIFAQLEQGYTSDPSLPTWVQAMYENDADFGLVESLYTNYYKTHSFVKDEHTQYFKRWKHEVNHESIPSRALDKEAWLLNQRAYLERTLALKNQKSGNSDWSSIGPFDFDKEAIDRSYAAGAAHVYITVQSASNPNILFAGTANAGLWKSIDKGQHWTGLTKDMMIKSIYAVVIDPTNSNIVYFGGDDGNLYKTTDGGATWNITGDPAFDAFNHDIRDLVIINSVPQKLLVASTSGFFMSTDGGNNFTQSLGGNIQEIEIKPDNQDVVYCIRQTANKTQFYKSINGASTFSLITNGWPIPQTIYEQKRTEIAISADAPNRVYALATGKANGSTGLYGIYISEDAGDSWTFTCCGTGPGGAPSTSNLNLMGWDDAGQDAGGQYYYDLALDVSPTNGDSIFVGGVNLWVSADAGVTWTCPSKWSHSYKDNYVHADIHDIRFFDNDLWVSNDGGIFYSNNTGADFSRRMLGIEGSDFWGFGAGFWEGDVMLGGAYHNGTFLKDHNVFVNGWISTDGGDGTRGFVNPGDDRVVYSDYNRKKLSGDRTINALTYPYNNKPNANGAGRESELVFDYECYTCFYTGFEENLWYTTDNGTSYELIYTFPANVGEIEISRANHEVIYVSTYVDYYGTKKVWKSTDKGQSFTDITPSAADLNGLASRPYVLAVSSLNADEIFVGRVGYFENLDGYKIFKSSNGGLTWQNITTTDLDGEMLVNIVHQQGTDGGIWIGTRRAVYYKNNSMNTWTLYNSELPAATYSTRLVPYYRKGKIRNATDRSVYEVDFIEPSNVLVQISVNSKNIACTQDTVFYVDNSILSEGGATWSWTFPGGSPNISNLRNPKVLYAQPGTYDVSLTVSDSSGTASQTLEDFIVIGNGCKLDSIPGNSILLTNSGDYCTTQEFNVVSNTMSFSAWIKPSDTANAYSGIVIGGANSTGGLNLRDNMELAYHWPGGEWWWESGLFVPVGEWSHVAMVVNPSSVTLYLNGVPSVHQINTDSCDFTNATYIGSYKAWNDRNYFGEIDEVCIWNRSLTQDEVREQMHLTKTPALDNGLLAYYQFNNSSGEVSDKANAFHASLSGGGARVVSTAPVGGGKSDRFTVTSSGGYLAPNTNSAISFITGSIPDGEIVISALELNPNILPDTFPSVGTYWIINNYGSLQTLNGLDELVLGNIALIGNADAASPDSFALYQRPFNSDLALWDSLDLGDDALAGSPGKVQFIDLSLVTQLSQQFVVLNKGMTIDSIVDPNALIELEQVKDIQVYPNPIDNTSLLKVSSSINAQLKFELYDYGGRKVLSKQIYQNGIINLGELSKGVYFYRVSVSKFFKQGKLVIE